MARAVPMVRSLSLIPAIRWLKSRDISSEPFLREAGLPLAPHVDPLRPVPLLQIGGFLRALARREGPDVPTRIVSEASVFELAMLGSIALGTRTPVEALNRISNALPLFCSHERLAIQTTPSLVDIWHSYTVKFDAETGHLMLQYAVAIADRLIGMTGVISPRLTRVDIAPHPEYGTAHLAMWFGDVVRPNDGHGIRISVDRAIAERPFSRVARDRLLAGTLPSLHPIRGDGSFGDSVKVMAASMLVDGVPAIGQMAMACGTSVRTLQRRLSIERLVYSDLVEEVRQAQALSLLAEPNATAKSVSAYLGYEHQSSLTRAMLRWTGTKPKQYKTKKA